MCHGGERKAIGAELLNDISELLPACFVCCPIESFKNTKLKKMKGIPNNKNFLKNFLPLTANVFFLLKIKKAQISVDISCSATHNNWFVFSQQNSPFIISPQSSLICCSLASLPCN